VYHVWFVKQTGRDDVMKAFDAASGAEPLHSFLNSGFLQSSRRQTLKRSAEKAGINQDLYA
jgi:hypothetical protein